MTEPVEPDAPSRRAGRRAHGLTGLSGAMRQRPLISLVGTLLLFGLLVFAVVEALGYSHAAVQASNTGSTTIGFVRLHEAKPPQFELTELTDPSIKESLAHYTGKPLLLNFWSSTCTICAQEATSLVHAYDQLGTQVEFVGIDTAEPSRTAGVSFARQHAMTYQLLFDGSAAVAGRYGVPGLPVTFFISRTGEVLGENFGALTVRSIDHIVHSLYGLSPS